MSYYDYAISREIAKQDPPFYGILMALIRKADDVNLKKIEIMWPNIVDEFKKRYHAPGGLLEGEPVPENFP